MKKKYVFWNNSSTCNVEVFKTKEELLKMTRLYINEYNENTEHIDWDHYKIFCIEKLDNDDIIMSDIFKHNYNIDPSLYICKSKEGKYVDGITMDYMSISDFFGCTMYKRKKEYFNNI